MFSQTSAAILVTGLLLGCGGGGGDGGSTPPPVIAVTVSPDSAQLVPSQTATFSAAVSGTNNQQVVWSIVEGLSGGTVNSSGVYTAPALAGTFHVVATSQADLSKNAIVPVIVRVVVAANPTTLNVTLRETRQLSATVTGSPNQSVTWNVQEGASGGAVSASGLYTAPATPGTYHVIATSQVDSSQSASVTITVLAGAANGTVE